MKRMIAFLMSLMLVLSLCACQIPEVNAPTTDPTTSTVVTDPTETTPSTETTVPSTDATESTETTWHLQEVADKLAGYAIEFEWNDGVVDIILTVGLPDLDMFDRVERINVTAYLIYLSDGTSYRMVLDAGSGDVVDIVNNVDVPTENDSYYKA
jgi:hypothetical protein